MSTAPTRRKRRMKAEDRREVILRRAADLFSRDGFRGTTTAALARAGGTSEAMLYKLFGSKRGLYAALIERRIRQAGDDMFPVDAADRRDDRAVFLTMAREFFRGCREDPAFTRLLLFSALEKCELTDLFYEARVRKVIGFLTDYIRRRAREGAFRRVKPDLAAFAFMGMVAQFDMARQVFRIAEARRMDPDEAATGLVDLFLGGLLT